MALFNFQFDTIAKTLKVDLDGVPVTDVERVSFYEFDDCCCGPDGGDFGPDAEDGEGPDEVETYRMEMVKTSVDSESKIRTTVVVCAADGSVVEDRVKTASLQLSSLTNANKK